MTGTSTAAAVAPVLPASLYFLNNERQIARLEADGMTVVQITTEDGPVLEFDVAPADGTLAYIIGSGADRRLVVADATGKDRLELFTGAISGVQVAPSGDEIAFRLEEPMEGLVVGEDRPVSGVLIMPKTGGRPGVLQADDPVPDPDNPPEDARTYRPIAWSPDGTRMLMMAQFHYGEGGVLTVKNREGGALVEVAEGCCEAAWSVDATSITIAGGIFVQDASLGLWRADPETGASQRLLPAQAGAGFTLVTAARQLREGNIYTFHANEQDVSDPERVSALTMSRITLDGTLTPLRSERQMLRGALWADDASGAVITQYDAASESGAGPLLWLPADNSPAVRLPAAGDNLRWRSGEGTE